MKRFFVFFVSVVVCMTSTVALAFGAKGVFNAGGCYRF